MRTGDGADISPPHEPRHCDPAWTGSSSGRDNSVTQIVTEYGFDGIDVGPQLHGYPAIRVQPRTRPREK